MTGVGDQARGASVAEVLAGGGEMGALMRAFDWVSTPLGLVDGWPQALKTCVRIMLTSRQPMWLGWGDELTFLYNDPYRSIVGGKHPWALGQPTAVVWREIWADIAPRIQSALGGDEGTYDEALLLIMERYGYPEETYYTFSYSPIPDDNGRVAGIFCANTDDTRRVIGERQLILLRELAAGTAEARTIADACTLSMRCLEANPRDVPFALLYLLDPDQRRAILAGMARIAPGHPAAPALIALDGAAAWPVAEVAQTNVPCLISDLGTSFGAVPAGAWQRPPAQAVALPIAPSSQVGQAGVLIVGLNPYRLFDDDYRGFLGLVAGQIGTAIANARAYEEERRRAEALAELDRAKTIFFSNVSHEFRTPLTLALGPVEEVLADPAEALSPAGRGRLEIARGNHLRLLKLVNTLLDFARIEAGRAEASYEPADLALLTADLASVFRSTVERAGLRLLVDCPPLPAPVYVDRDMWEKIVLNLLSNAFKYTFAGELAVVLRAAGESVALEVRDTGTGIPAEEISHLFERFHRVQGTRARTHEGTGIGLALVQELVRLHGGTIEVASAVGVGTTVTVVIPMGAAHLPAGRLAAERAGTPSARSAAPYVEEALRWLPEPNGDGPAQPGRASWAAEGDNPAPETAAHILLADDNADMRAYVGHLLGARYTVEAVPDGESALAAARARPPHLVLADVMMPGLDGFGLLRELRADPRTATLPVLLLSARAGQEATAAGLEAGADDYLVKPFAASELLARVQAHLALARIRQQATETEQALRAEAEQERQHLRDLFEQAPALIAVLRGPQHVYEVANPLYVQTVGRHDASQLLGRPVREALSETDRQGSLGQSYFDLLDQVYASGTPFVGAELPIQLDRRGDGSLEEVFLNFVLQPYRNAAGAVGGIFIHAVEVTEQVRARQRVEELARQVQEERDRWRQVLDVLPVGVVIVDARGQVEVLNQTGRDIVGRDTRGQPLPTPGDEETDAYRVRRPDGTPYPPAEVPLRRSLLSGEEVRGDRELHLHAVTGRETPLLVNSAPLRDAAGAIVGAVAVFQDITALRELERAREEFLSSAAHDLKTPLTSIRGQAQLAQRRLARLEGVETAPVADQLTRIQEGADAMVGLINELADVAGQQMGRVLEMQRESTDLVGLVRGYIEAQRAVSGRRIELEADMPALVAEVDAARIERVLGNLLSNALKYSPAGSAITVRLARDEGAAGPRAVLSVRDEGIGIPAADLPHIFDRFVRAGNVAGHIQGTGIGLASARGIVEQHGGTIAVRSEEGVGSTFTVYLPLTPPQAVTEAAWHA